jgi:hypothetical protein
MRFSAWCLPGRLCCFGKPGVGSPHQARHNQVLQGDGGIRSRLHVEGHFPAAPEHER